MENQSFLLNFKHSSGKAFKVDVTGDSWLWHKRLGYLNFWGLKLLYHKNMVQGLPKIEENDEVCEGCALGKHHRRPIPK